NKSDLDPVIEEEKISILTNKPILKISAIHQTGIKELEQTITEMFFEGNISFNDEIYITNMRHKNALVEAKISLEQVIVSIDNEMPEDFFSIDLMNAYEILGTIIGESVDEDLVNTIFKEFCMGK
ncbi:MAG TPA: tRNA uridine-5-carboxymethylaminomethyl(34) synthesis GTPase MnmE, partial [Lachnoclostridium phytofermentans]|nr:tRNA uridine-5-carboxymethylaminomethyl(34) synthesis GTPase MnmE [Lachnoclostridium phytofermentans]